ncbi:hypothetical protein FHS85_000446 [Rhodoligotrophos appendicifer]|uniref:CocE/NonD family hydrolase n=1 Tax=Rhodoligotrophos appendicifer TaxID=987056 RepID=UPI00117CA1A8|nr:CocE/NonD family hydrolase [Rhodoligotrophos appendicifer]
MASSNEPSQAIETRDTVFVPLSDGTRIAATIWLPQTAEMDPVPAVIEMIPYRRRNGTIFRDANMHPYVAAHGFACIRIDLRGSGESDGLLRDEYLPQEQNDALEIIDWIASQPWCSGHVGMTGISWGGFNSLQVAAHRPKPLKAILALCCADDRYADDVHYMGGCLLTENPLWSAVMYSYNALPPDPQIVGERWREMWRDRLDANRPWLETWLSHQRRDEYWKQGSVCEDYSRIQCAVYAIAGWDDSYSNAVPRLLANLTGPKKGLVGPWSHDYPYQGSPEPVIDYLGEAVRWWRHWLYEEETGIMDEPTYRVWLMEPHDPKPYYLEHPGRWVAEPTWPSPRTILRNFALTDHDRLAEHGIGTGSRLVSTPQTAGIESGRWGGYGGTSPDMAIDQRAEDGIAASFTSPPLDDDLEILGAATLDIAFTSETPCAQLAVRLCNVAPDGTSALITYGVLNLAHADNHQTIRALEPGHRYTAQVKLNDIAYRIPAGHRIRVAVSTTYWPVLFPQPFAAAVDLQLDGCKLTLPQRPSRPEDLELRDLGTSRHAAHAVTTVLRPAYTRRTITEDAGSGTVTIVVDSDHGATRLDDYAITQESRLVESFTICRDDPLSAEVVGDYAIAYRSGDANIEIRTRTRLTASAEVFHIDCRLTAYDDGSLVLDRTDRRSIPRDGM